jgi:hypothetical protein
LLTYFVTEGVTVIIPSKTRDVWLLVSSVFTSNRYLPGLMLEVFAAVIDIVISPFATLESVHVILAEILAE